MHSVRGLAASEAAGLSYNMEQQSMHANARTMQPL